MVWLPDGKKLNIFFIRSNRIHERDRQTDRRTYKRTEHDGICRAYAQHPAGKTVTAFAMKLLVMVGTDARTLTRDIHVAILYVCPSVRMSVRPSVRLFVTFQYQMKTARSFKMALFDRPCTTFYWSAIVTIAPSCTLSSYLTLNNIVTLKSRLAVTQGHWNWCQSKAWVWFPIFPIRRL